MMMMQRLLQESSADTPAATSPRTFSFANGGNILHHHPASAFLRPPSSRSEDTRDSGKEGEEECSDSGRQDRVCAEGDDSKSRVSEESVDVQEANDRLSSDEDLLTVDGSPVDLTSRHRLLRRTPSDNNDESPRLAFSVENILDPTKFTGKDREAALLRPLDLERLQTHWRPLDHTGVLIYFLFVAYSNSLYRAINLCRNIYIVSY